MNFYEKQEQNRRIISMQAIKEARKNKVNENFITLLSKYADTCKETLKICKNCQILFVTLRRQHEDNICIACKNKLRKQQPERVKRIFSEKKCIYCGKKYIPVNIKQKYCSKYCFLQSSLERRGELSQCKNCQKEFIVKYKNQKYCSIRCARIDRFGHV